MNEINPIHTPCLDCVFAVYSDNTQTGCAMNMLSLYEDKEGIDIIEAYNDEKEFFIINNKKCFAYKIPAYFKNREMENSTLEEKIDYVTNLMKMKYALVVDVRNMTIMAFRSILDKLKNKTEVSPSLIVLTTHHTNKIDISHYYKSIIDSGINSRWKIRSLSDVDTEFCNIIHEAVNNDVTDCNFILAVNGKDYSNLIKIVNYANRKVYENFETFVSVVNESRGIMLFNNQVYKQALLSGIDILTKTTEHTIV
jgi:hypothetical protein